MVINIKTLAVILFVYIITICSSCGNLICADAIDYTFSVKEVKVYPDKDSIRIGDTVYVEMLCPTTNEDVVSHRMIDYSGAANFGTAFQLSRLAYEGVTDTIPVNANDNFNYFIIIGKPAREYAPTGARNYLFVEENKFFQLKVGIIPKNTGVYVLGISDASGVYRSGNNCTKAAFEFAIDSTDQHFYYYKNWNPNAALDGLNAPKMYCFKVY